MRLRQLRAFRIDDVQVQAEGHVGFHSSVFGIKDSYDTIFDRGCFAKTLDENQGLFPVAWFHDPRTPIALGQHIEDATGLRVEADLDLDVEAGRNVYSGLKKGYIDCASIAFDCMTDQTIDDVVHFKEVRLFESSLLTRGFASNPAALVDEVRARTGLDYMRPPVLAVTESELRRTVEVLAALRERELTEPEQALVFECADALDMMLSPGEGRPYPNEHACHLQPPSKFSDFRRGTRKHEGKTYSIIFGKVKDGETWEEQAYRYAKDVWEAADARAHCKSHDGKFEAASSENSVGLDDTAEPPKPSPLTIALACSARDMAAALASRGPIRSPLGTGRTSSIAPDLHAVLTELQAVGRGR